MRVIVDQGEDIGRVGFAGLLAETNAQPPIAAESPESWAPIGVSSGSDEHAQRQAVEAFCLWLEGQRHEHRS